MCCNPWAIVHWLESWDQRPSKVESDIARTGDSPSCNGVVSDVRVDEVQMVGVVESHVAFVAEFMLFKTGWG